MGNPFLGAIKTTFFNIRQYHRRLYIKCHRISLQEACNFSTCLAAHLPGEAPYLLHRAADYLVDMADGLWHKQPLLPIGRCDHRSLKNGEEKKNVEEHVEPRLLAGYFLLALLWVLDVQLCGPQANISIQRFGKKMFCSVELFSVCFPIASACAGFIALV